MAEGFPPHTGAGTRGGLMDCLPELLSRFSGGLPHQLTEVGFFQLREQGLLGLLACTAEGGTDLARLRSRMVRDVEQIAAVEGTVDLSEGNGSGRTREARSAMRTFLAVQQSGAVQQREDPADDNRIDVEPTSDILRSSKSVRFGSEQDQGVNAG